MTKHHSTALCLAFIAILASCAAPLTKTNANRKLDDIRIPVLEFQNAESRDVLARVTSESKRFDPQNQGLRFVLKNSPIPYAPIKSLRLVDVPLRVFVTFFRQLTSCDHHLVGRTLTFYHRDPAEAERTTHRMDYPSAKPNYPFFVKITDFYGAAGYGFDYYVDKATIVVVLWDDYGNPRREVLNRSLTRQEARDWARFWSQFDVTSLKELYTNPNVIDGFERQFTFRIDNSDKKVTVEKVAVKELSELSQKINTFVPKEIKMRGGLR